MSLKKSNQAKRFFCIFLYCIIIPGLFIPLVILLSTSCKVSIFMLYIGLVSIYVCEKVCEDKD